MLLSQFQDKLSCSFYVATSYNKKIFFGKAHILGGNGMVQQHTCSWVGEEILGSKQLKKPIFVGIYWTPKSLEFFSPIARAVWHGRLKKFRFRLCAPNLSVSLPIYRQNTRIVTMNTLKFQIKDTAKKITMAQKRHPFLDQSYSSKA